MHRRTSVLRSGAVLVASLGLAALATAQPTGTNTRGAEPSTNRRDAAAVKGESYGVDPVHSMAMFRVRHLGAGAFWGRFNTVTGTIRYDESSDTGLFMDIAIAIDSVDTGNESLDGHLQSDDFFAAEEHPMATFKSTSAKKVNDKTYKVTGELTMRGTTKRITVDVKKVGLREGGRGKRLGFETSFDVLRSEYGIAYGIANGAIDDDTRIIVAMESIAGQEARGGEGGRGGRGGRGGDGGRGGRGGRGGAGGGTGAADADNPLGRLSRFDTDGDGKVSKDEAPEQLERLFGQLDANDDGFIDAEEVKAMGGRGGRGGRGGGTGGGRGGDGGTSTGGGGG